MHHPPVLAPRHAALERRWATRTVRGGFAWSISFITKTFHAAAVAEPSPATRARNRVMAILILVVQVVGTIGFTSYALWKFFQEERGDALLYLSIAIAWYLLLGWRLRWLLHPKPAA